MHARQQTHADGPADRLGDLALVHGAQARVAAVPDAAHGRHVLEHDGGVLSRQDHSVRLSTPLSLSLQKPVLECKKRTEATHLVLLQRPDPQDVKHVPVAALPRPPLLRLGGAEVVRGVHVARLPLVQAGILALEVAGAGGLGGVEDGGSAFVVLAHRLVAVPVHILEHVAGEGEVAVAGGEAGDVGGEGGGLAGFALGGGVGAGRGERGVDEGVVLD